MRCSVQILQLPKELTKAPPPPAVINGMHCLPTVLLLSAYMRCSLSFIVVRSSGVEHHIAFGANLFDQIKLVLEEVDMFLLAVQDLLQ